MQPTIRWVSAALAFATLSTAAFADDCHVIGAVGKSNASKPLGSPGNPYGSLAAVQADLNCDTIIVLHSEVVLDGGITLRDGQRLVGRAGPGRALPIIANTTGLNGGHGVQLSANNAIDSLHIANTQNSGVFGTDVGNLEIVDSLITGFAMSGSIKQAPAPLDYIPVSWAGIELHPANDAKIRISGAELGEANSTSISIWPFGNHTDVIIENVQVRDTGIVPGAAITPGIVVFGLGFASVNVQVQSTSVSNIGADLCNCDGLALLASGNSTMNARVDGYRYNNPDGDGGGSATGIEAGLYFASGGRFEGTFRNSNIRGSTASGIQLLSQAPGDSNQLDVQVRDNQIFDSPVGIQLVTGFASTHGTHVVKIENNLIENASLFAIMFLNAIEHQNLVHLLVRRNTVVNSFMGLYFEQGGGGSVGNLILDAGLGGLGGDGHNRILGSQFADIYVATFDCCGFPLTPAFAVDAADNWWGTSAGPVSVIESGAATVDVTPFLTEDPGEN